MMDHEDDGHMPSDDTFHDAGGYVDDAPPMSRPTLFLMRMGGFLVLVLVGVAFIWQPVARAFTGNLYINSVILAVFLLATAYCFLRVYLLFRDVAWLADFRGGDPGLEHPPRGSLLSPLSAVLRGRPAPVYFSEIPARIVIDSIASRLHEARENTRYAGNLLIFLGILGTFWGLIISFGSLTDAVTALGQEAATAEGALSGLQEGLTGPLSAVVTAVSSSLFGFAGALVVGFFGLQAAQAQTRFFNEFEDWIASVTQLGGKASADEDTNAGFLREIADAMHENVRQVTALRESLQRAEDERQQLGEWVTKTAQNLSGVDDILRTQKDVLTGIAGVVQDVANAANERGKQSLEVLQGMQRTIAAKPAGPATQAAPASVSVNLEPVEQRLGQLITATEATGDRMTKTITALHELSARVMARSEQAGQAAGGPEGRSATGAETVALLKSLNDKTGQLLVATTSGLAAAARFAPGASVEQQAPVPAAAPLDLSALNDLNGRVGELVRIAQAMERSQGSGDAAQLNAINATMNKILQAVEQIGGAESRKSIDAIAHYTRELAQLARGSSEGEIVEALRSLNQITHSIREGAEEGRTEVVQELRAEMKILTKTIAALIIESRRGGPAPRGTQG